jgi:hypothetical protein
VEARLVEQVRRRPPKSDLVLDVLVENPEEAARWCILPAVLPVPEEGGIFGVEVSLLGGEGRVLVGRLLGRRAAHALLLPAGARIRLRQLVVGIWGELEPPLRLDVALATRALLGDEDLLAWFPSDPLCDVEADVGAPVDLLAARSAEGLKEQPLALQGVTSAVLEVRI